MGIDSAPLISQGRTLCKPRKIGTGRSRDVYLAGVRSIVNNRNKCSGVSPLVNLTVPIREADPACVIMKVRRQFCKLSNSSRLIRIHIEDYVVDRVGMFIDEYPTLAKSRMEELTC